MDPTKTETEGAKGTPLSKESKVLETGAAAGQVVFSIHFDWINIQPDTLINP